MPFEVAKLTERPRIPVPGDADAARKSALEIQNAAIDHTNAINKIERVGNELHPSPETTYKIAEPITHHNHLTAAENVLAFLENEQPLGFPLNPELESYGWRPIRFVPPSPDDPERADGRRRSRSRSR